MKTFQKIFLLILMSAIVSPGVAQSIEFSSDSMPPYHTLINAWEDSLVYRQDASGNRVPDFSYCGYMASEAPIPNVPVKIIVPVPEGDATPHIQAAIDYVSSLEMSADGFRGTVVLDKGRFVLEGSLEIRTSGVVLRGSGCGSDGTVLVAAGTGRETLLEIRGEKGLPGSREYVLEDRYYPVNSTEFYLEAPHHFESGDLVVVRRPSTVNWIEAIGTGNLGVSDFRTMWTPGDFDLVSMRKVEGVGAQSIVLDAPLTEALDPVLGDAVIAKLESEGRLYRVGVENLRCVSEFDPAYPKDENHRWMAVSMNHVSDAWIRRLVAENFVSSAVAVWEGSRRVTVEDCKSLSPVAEEGNYRRLAFQTLGQQVLFQRCYAEEAYHAFSVGFTTPGPNAFVQCHSHAPLHFSGAVGGWSTGILFDGVTIDGGDISFGWRDMDGQGGGWSASNSLCWQCRAAKVIMDNPPGSRNWAYGCWAQPQGSADHQWPHTFLKPVSLYYEQLERRLGERPADAGKLLIYNSSESTAPQPDVAVEMSMRSRKPDVTMDRWIDSLIQSDPLPLDGKKSIKYRPSKDREETPEAMPLQSIELVDGQLLRDGVLLVGKRMRTALWRGSTRPGDLNRAAPHLSRFVPGRTGRGLTDDLEVTAGNMGKGKVVALSHFPSLWYERRRDDHSRTRRSDADVWTPFYEQPFSRSGQGLAFDGLSKYDLDRWNPWYWSRLEEFAGHADSQGILFIQEHYLQHNIIEEGAHWVDYPWRSANNINKLGFAEPPHYSGDKRVFMAGEFYDTTHLQRKQTHERYIRKSLENLSGHKNILHDIGHEYTGPLHFMQFWLDQVAGWEKESGEDVMVLLQGTKDVQDGILSDPERSGLVDAIDIRQWHYREDGSLYAPEGGVSLTQRQYARIFEPGDPGFGQIYRAVSETRANYPDKAVISSMRSRDPFASWAAFMAGGSLTDIPHPSEKGFLEMATGAKTYRYKDQTYILEKEDAGYIVYTEDGVLDPGFCVPGVRYLMRWVNASDGKASHRAVIYDSGKIGLMKTPYKGPGVAWLVKMPDTKK